MSTAREREYAPAADAARAPDARGALPPPDGGVVALLRAGREMTPREAELYVRYLRALALLGECAPFVEDADYAELIGTLFADAQANYPLAIRRHGERWEVAPLS